MPRNVGRDLAAAQEQLERLQRKRAKLSAQLEDCDVAIEEATDRVVSLESGDVAASAETAQASSGAGEDA